MQNSWILFKGKVGRESVIFAVPGEDKETTTAFRSFLKQKGGCPGNIAVAVCDMSKALNITQIVKIFGSSTFSVDLIYGYIKSTEKQSR